MNCNRHPEATLEKIHLDRYYCPECDHDWLIHPFRADRRGVRKNGKAHSYGGAT